MPGCAGWDHRALSGAAQLLPFPCQPDGGIPLPGELFSLHSHSAKLLLFTCLVPLQSVPPPALCPPGSPLEYEGCPWNITSLLFPHAPCRASSFLPAPSATSNCSQRILCNESPTSGERSSELDSLPRASCGSQSLPVPAHSFLQEGDWEPYSQTPIKAQGLKEFWALLVLRSLEKDSQ